MINQTLPEAFNLLIVEDNQQELSRLERVFLRQDPACRVLKASTPTAALNQYRKHHPEVVLLDLSLNGHGPSHGLELISKMTTLDPTTRIIVLTGHIDEAIGVQSIKNGAASFLTKPANALALETLVIDYAQTAKFKRNAQLKDPAPPIPGLLGQSPAMKNVYRLIHQCALTDANVLIVGETGTGKELVAKAIHQLSPRRSAPLSVYFGSAPGSLAEAELFGYVRGAYTGAHTQGSVGSIGRSEHGTLFIDELCSLDLDIQRKLLRTVEEKTFKPLGSDTYQKADFRLLTAAQPRIYDLVRQGLFREDLLSRIEVVTIHLPPLRERREDIIPLCEYFLKQAISEVSATAPCHVTGFAHETIRAFREYAWPRNLRQLKHTIHNGTIQAQLRNSTLIAIQDVKDRLLSLTPSPIPTPLSTTLKHAVSQLEQQMITTALQQNSYSLSATSQDLGLGRTTLWRKLREYNIQVKGE